MFVKPAEGRTVRRPDTLVHLPTAGEHVPDGDEFWTRRLRDGDVEAVDPPEALDPTEANRSDGFFEIGKHSDTPASDEESPA